MGEIQSGENRVKKRELTEVIMTRAEAKQKLISYGIAEPTDEQITDLLNSINAETKKEKDRADGLKAKADKADELQSELDKINEQNLSEVEKANKLVEQANNRIAELEKAQAISVQKSTVIDKFKVTAEQANQIVKEDGSLDYDVLGQIISDKELAAATAKEKEIRDNSGNPGGGNGGDNDTKSKAEQIASKLFGGQKQENNILSHYVNGGN